MFTNSFFLNKMSEFIDNELIMLALFLNEEEEVNSKTGKQNVLYGYMIYGGKKACKKGNF